MILELVIAVTAIGAWFGVFGACLLLTRPREVRPAGPTQDFGGSEPPAVVSLLVNRWEVTENAAQSTLLDLAARRLIELRQPGDDPAQTTIHLRAGPGGGVDGPDLRRYERRVLDRVSGLAVGGVVPLPALTFRDPAQARTWARKLKAEVIADVRSRGLSQRRFSPRAVTVLTVAAAGAAAGVFVAMLHYAHRTHPHDDPAVAASLMTFLALFVIAGTALGERDTPAGREAAARWLALRAFLRGDEAFALLPPASVAVWDRYLSYGCALGVTRVCSAAIDLGMGNRERVWSSFGGSWHQVRVRYPRFWAHYGRKSAPLVFWSLVCLAAGYGVLRSHHVLVDAVPDRFYDLAALVTFLLGAGLILRGGYRLVRVAVDPATQVTLSGEVLWTEVWKSTGGGEDSPPTPWLYYLAVDDGTDDRTTAWALPSELHPGCEVGDVARLTARPWTRRVVELSVVEPGRVRRLSDTADDKTENLVAAALGTLADPAAGVPVAAMLLTADEVGRATGRPMTTRQPTGTTVGPVSIQMFEANGARAVYLGVTDAMPGRLAMRAGRTGTALSGIGDEAYADERGAVGRRGNTVVVLRLHDAAGTPDPRNIQWLLATAVSSLLADRARRAVPGPPRR